MKTVLISTVILVVVLTCSPLTAKAARPALATTEQTGQGNFITGLFGPLVFLVSAPKILFSTTPEGSSLVDALLAQTWGKGTASYRVGFVCGAILLLSIPGIIGSANQKK